MIIECQSFSGSIQGVTVAGQSGVPGSWSYQLNYPTGIVLDQNKNMYIVDGGNNRIQRWSPGSTYGVTIASSTSLLDPRGIAIDTLGNLVVADCDRHRVISFFGRCSKFHRDTSVDFVCQYSR